MSQKSAHWLIGDVAAASGLTPKMIRHYESLGLISPPERSQSGYRYYDQPVIDELVFIRQARELGFGLPQIADLMRLWRNESRHASEVHALATRHLAELDRKISELQRMRTILTQAVSSCPGDQQSDCPILDQLAPAAKKSCHS